jgi:hypothetical protein
MRVTSVLHRSRGYRHDWANDGGAMMVSRPTKSIDERSEALSCSMIMVLRQSWLVLFIDKTWQ